MCVLGMKALDSSWTEALGLNESDQTQILAHQYFSTFTTDEAAVCPEGKMYDIAPSFFTGPAQVPMMSPNGSVPPIYVPPGYVSQVCTLYYFKSSVFLLSLC